MSESERKEEKANNDGQIKCWTLGFVEGKHMVIT